MGALGPKCPSQARLGLSTLSSAVYILGLKIRHFHVSSDAHSIEKRNRSHPADLNTSNAVRERSKPAADLQHAAFAIAVYKYWLAPRRRLVQGHHSCLCSSRIVAPYLHGDVEELLERLHGPGDSLGATSGRVCQRWTGQRAAGRAGGALRRPPCGAKHMQCAFLGFMPRTWSASCSQMLHSGPPGAAARLPTLGTVAARSSKVGAARSNAEAPASAPRPRASMRRDMVLQRGARRL